MKANITLLVSLILISGALLVPLSLSMSANAAEAKNINCSDLKTLVLKFNKPVHDFSVNVCPTGGGGPGPAGPAGPAGANGRDGINGLNGTTLPTDVIDKINTLAAKAGVLDQIVAAYENGSLGNGGVSIGCIAFPNGTSIGECPADNGTTTQPPNDNGTVVVPPVDNNTGTGTNDTGGVIPPVDNGTVVPPVDNGTVIVEPPVDNGTVIVPPNNGTVVVPPENGTVIVDNGTSNPTNDTGNLTG